MKDESEKYSIQFASGHENSLVIIFCFERNSNIFLVKLPE